jgi:hypothetical protein
MFDYSLQGILDQIASFNTFGLVYIIAGGLLFGAISAYYWGMRKAIVVGSIVVLLLFLFLSFQEVGLTSQLIPNFISFFRGIFYTLLGLTVGAVLTHLLFNINR